MNRYFLRLPFSNESLYRAAILVATPEGLYYWVHKGESRPPYTRTLSEADRQILLTSDKYLELHSSINPQHIVNLSNIEPTASAWTNALAACRVVSVPFSEPKVRYSKLHTNHKIGAPKGKLP